MEKDFPSFIEKSLNESAKVKIETARLLSKEIAKAIEMIINAYKRDNKVLLCGNGGSAADCQHIAAELVGRFKKERRALPAIALTTDTSCLTAISNDYGYGVVFRRQVEALGKEGDILLCFSTSGNSGNVIEAAKFARTLNIKTIGLLGKDGGLLKDALDLAITVPAQSSDRIQEAHITIGHIICDLVEQNLEP